MVNRWLIAHDRVGDLIDQVDEAEARLARTEADFRDTKDKLQRYGLTTTVGLLLRQKKEQLRHWRASSQANGLAHEDLAAVRDRRLSLELGVVDATLIADQAADRLSAARVDPAGQDGRRWLPIAEDLLRRRQDWIAATADRYTRQTEEIGRLDTARQALTRPGRRLRRLD